MIRKDGHIRKAEDKYLGPFTITQVHTNGTIRIQRGTMSERINIRRVTPFLSEQTISLLKRNMIVGLYVKLERPLGYYIINFDFLFLESKL
jgi:hypothetical protein